MVGLPAYVWIIGVVPMLRWLEVHVRVKAEVSVWNGEVRMTNGRRRSLI